MKLHAGSAVLCAVLSGAPAANSQPAPQERISVQYVEPTDPAHRALYELAKDKQVLERVRELLVPVRWPRTLQMVLTGCDGESNAWYENEAVTVCYEYLDDIWRAANSPKRPPGVSREDAIAGPVLDVFLHEAGHAMFALLKIPILGREEDAADQVAAHFILKLPDEVRRGFILGAAYSYANELKVRNARDLYRRRLEVGRHVLLSDEHSTAAQRLYNLLCLAYGSDKVLFSDVVQKKFLPEERAETCEGEYQQVDYAYRTLIAPHVDSGSR
jgi:hypothetical protein